jgi:hypothetical protein
MSGRHVGRWACAVLLAVVVVVFGLGQLILPGIATSNLDASLSQGGVDAHASVSAFPAIKLLFGYADRVNVRITRLSSGSGSIDGLLASASKVGTLDATVAELDADGLRLTNVSLTKHGNILIARANVTRSAIASILPVNLRILRPAPGSSGIAFEATVDAFGQTVSAAAGVDAVSGQIDVEPNIPLVGDVSALDITVFSDRRVSVDSVSASPRGDSYALRATAHYR